MCTVARSSSSIVAADASCGASSPPAIAMPPKTANASSATTAAIAPAVSRRDERTRSYRLRGSLSAPGGMCAWKVVSPMRTFSPSRRSVRSPRRLPSTKVPLAEPSSRSSTPPLGRARKAACRREARSSAIVSRLLTATHHELIRRQLDPLRDPGAFIVSGQVGLTRARIDPRQLSGSSASSPADDRLRLAGEKLDARRLDLISSPAESAIGSRKRLSPKKVPFEEPRSRNSRRPSTSGVSARACRRRARHRVPGRSRRLDQS